MGLWQSIKGLFRAQPSMADVMGTYDAARAINEFANYWENTDALDADSAHSVEVRQKLVQRSRYEVANNGYADGIARTYANDLVGNGPSLRMRTRRKPFNEMVEREFNAWAEAIGLRRKLWTMAHAKHVDGEGFGIVAKNAKIDHTVQLDIVLRETEQCQTPNLPLDDPNYIDGIKFDDRGNILHYDFLSYHPGGKAAISPQLVGGAVRVPPNQVLHWFKVRRPGQHRGVPENASTLNLGAAARSWRQSTLGAAEAAAQINVLLKTGFQPDQVANLVPFTTADISRRSLTALPSGWDTSQIHAEFPTTSHAEFHRVLINEQARPRSMPYNKAACDSADYNYASGRLDHQTYYGELDVERFDANDSVLVKAFRLWFDMAVMEFGWLGGDPRAIGPSARLHSWDWPKHRVADVEAEANANETRLRSGQVGLRRLYHEASLDLEDEINSEAEFYGITPEEYRRRLLDAILPPAGGGESEGTTRVRVASALRSLAPTNGVVRN